MLSRNHIKIAKEIKPNWLQLEPNEEFIGQGSFTKEIGSEPSNHWVIKSVNEDDLRESIYYALYNRSKVRLDQKHVKNSLNNMQDNDDTSLAVFDYKLPQNRPLPLPLIDVLAKTDNPSVYAPVKINLLVELNDAGEVANLEWGDFSILLPRPADRTSNILPTLAWDNTDYAIPSTKKQYLAWRDLLLKGIIPNVKSKLKKEPLVSKLDLNDPAIKALINFLKNDEIIDLSGKPKSLAKPRICYVYRKTGKPIAHCNSIRAMAKELLGAMDEEVTQSPMLALHGNTVRILNTPSIDNISYGTVPTIKRGLVLSAFDEFQKNRKDMFAVNDVGIMLYRDDNERSPLIAVFEGLITKTANNDAVSAAYEEFMSFKVSTKREYKLLAFDLTSKGSVRCRLATKFTELDFYEFLKRSLNLTATFSSKKPISFYALPTINKDSFPIPKGRIFHIIEYMIGMADTIGHQYIIDVKNTLERSNDYEFYMRKHFLKIADAW